MSIRRCSITRAFFSRASVSKYAFVTSSVPECLVLQFAESANLLQKPIQIFRQNLDDHLRRAIFHSPVSRELVVATYPRSSLAKAVIFCTASSKLTISSSTSRCESICDLPTLKEAFPRALIPLRSSSLGPRCRFPLRHLRLRCLRWWNCCRERFEVSFEF